MPPDSPPIEELLRDGMSFLSNLSAFERHRLGAHYTCERDIQRIVQPTIVEPWKRRIAAARSPSQLAALYAELCQFRILDPACGCGNFLLVTFEELRRLEENLLQRLGTLAVH